MELLALASQLRPELHRYCARLMGSVIDGEDVVQDTFARAFVALDELREVPLLRAWLFRSRTRARPRRRFHYAQELQFTGFRRSIDFKARLAEYRLPGGAPSNQGRGHSRTGLSDTVRARKRLDGAVSLA